MSTVLFAQSAQTDLLEAWLFIAEENLSAADKVLDTIEHEANTLATQPLMGRACVPIWPRVFAAGQRPRLTFCFTWLRLMASLWFVYCTMPGTCRASRFDERQQHVFFFSTQ